MDAVKFLEERKRMFKNGNPVPGLGIDINYNSEKVVKIVEEWSAAHPRKTRQDLFLEQWPTALMDPIAEDGLLYACPTLFSSEYRDKNGCCAKPNRPCAECRREFWMQEVE
ncbi:hypothetical protein MM35RIKEN_16550 (plasmid) [Vescimonas fastidiosa]|uniref:Uncharacterized protein n=1 Tax=Vescimonas fastidiosa TaxID=2714353 RepID=A0A810Q3Y7_9FIRM|nr:hypothetical protein [Vescimonas fastidiosa]BCK79463.1 hypothetical protein MM35RIKEN_16550 [Vescimonas fastidiosa]